MVFQTNEQYFHEILEESFSRFVLVDFYAPWCAPCRLLAPELEQFSEQEENFLSAYSVNIDTEKTLAERYHVQEIPTVILFRNGQPFQQWEKQISLEKIRNVLDKIKKSGS